MDKNVNKELLKSQKDWEDSCYKPLREEYQNNEAEWGKLSCAFSFGVSRKYMESDKKVMIIGQEANGHTFDYDNWRLERWQEWAVSYLNRQVNREKIEGFSYNRSPFWRFFRNFDREGYAPCWNNIDKVRKYSLIDSKNWVEQKLPYDDNNKDREKLNKKIFEGKSLLQKEIEIVKPDIVVFAIGPNQPYFQALHLAFSTGEEFDEQLKNLMPTPENYCQDISRLLGLGMSAYWTYHPNYLSRNGLMNKVIEQILGNRN